MTRRNALVLLTTVSAGLVKSLEAQTVGLDHVFAQKPLHLTLGLTTRGDPQCFDQIIVHHDGETLTFTAKEIFEALKKK